MPQHAAACRSVPQHKKFFRGTAHAWPQHTNHWAPRTRKRHQQEHRPQWPTERSDPMQHAKGRTGDCPGPRKGATTRRNVTQGGPPGDLGGRRAFWGESPQGRARRLNFVHCHCTRVVACCCSWCSSEHRGLSSQALHTLACMRLVTQRTSRRFGRFLAHGRAGLA